MRRTRFGAQLYAIGGNPEAARLSGINLSRAIFWNFVIAGLRLRHHRRRADRARQRRDRRQRRPVPGTRRHRRGDHRRHVACPAVAAASSARLLGALLMGSLNNGMSLMNVPTFYQDTARGVVLLLAVAIDQLSRRRSGARR